MAKTQTIVLSLGGSLIAPAEGDGVVFVKQFRTLVLRMVKAGTRFVIVTGGGAPARMYQERMRAVGLKDSELLDWVGIGASHANARYIWSLFRDVVATEIISNPLAKVLPKGKVVIAGGHHPGNSTDLVAVQLARAYKAACVVNLSNVEYVYDKDPKQSPDAKRYLTLTWKEMQGIVGEKWTPGMHTPFDPIATKFAHKNKMHVAIVSGARLNELTAIANGKPFHGTWIRP
jgi:uridylate kinase